LSSSENENQDNSTNKDKKKEEPKAIEAAEKLKKAYT
jgi:hypothetical protein